MKEEEFIQYAGKWRLFDDTEWYDGTLHVDSYNKTLFLEIIIPSKEGKPAPILPFVGKVPFVNGVLYNNAKVLLYKCEADLGSTYVKQYTRQGISAQCCFWGLTIKEEQELVFSNVEFDFGEIIEWSTLCEYKWDWANGVPSAFVWDKKQDVTFQLREGVKVTLHPKNHFGLSSSYSVETTIKQQITIEIHYNNLTTWDSIINDVLSLRYFVGLGMNRFIGIESAHYYHSSLNISIPNEKGVIIEKPLLMEVLLGNHETVKTAAGNSFEYSFTLSDCIQYNMFQKWSDIYPKLKPVLDLYFASGRYNLYVPEIVFLNLMQALETYHARFIADTKDAYIKHIENSLDLFFYNGSDAKKRQENLLNYTKWKEKLICSRQKNARKDSVLLISRLSDLIFADGEICWWTFDNGKREDFAQKLVDTRNYYTHYDEKKKAKAYTEDELPYVNQHLRCLLKYHLLTKLGYDKKKAKEKALNERSRINVYFQIYNRTNAVKETHEES